MSCEAAWTPGQYQGAAKLGEELTIDCKLEKATIVCSVCSCFQMNCAKSCKSVQAGREELGLCFNVAKPQDSAKQLRLPSMSSEDHQICR